MTCFWTQRVFNNYKYECRLKTRPQVYSNKSCSRISERMQYTSTIRVYVLLLNWAKFRRNSVVWISMSKTLFSPKTDSKFTNVHRFLWNKIFCVNIIIELLRNFFQFSKTGVFFLCVFVCVCVCSLNPNYYRKNQPINTISNI